MQMLYQMDIQNDYSKEAKELFLKGKASLKEQKPYVDEIFKQVTENETEITEAFNAASDKWKINRLPKVDLAIIKIAIAEILYCPDIPEAVSVNEAVDLAKKYGTDNSFKFINGVLGKVAQAK